MNVTRDEVDELMLLYAAGIADDAERDTAEALLSGNDFTAQSAYAEAQAVLAAMPLSLRQVQAPRAVRDRLLFRVTADLQASKSSTRVPIQSVRRINWPTYISTGIAAALAIALTLTVLDNRRLRGMYASTWTDAQTVRTEYQQLETKSADRLKTIETTRVVMGSPYASLAKLSTDEKKRSYGHVLYCPVQRQFQVAVYELSPPKDGRVFELWFITPDQKKIPAGTFSCDAGGTGMISAIAPAGVTVALAAITDEPAGGSAQPTGSIHLAGALQSQTQVQ